MFLATGYERCDVIADRYFEGSLKEGTRDKRGNDGSTLKFTGDTQFPSDFKDFLSNSQNKDKLNEFLAQELISIHKYSTLPLTVVATFQISILINQHDIFECTAEEADTRIQMLFVVVLSLLCTAWSQNVYTVIVKSSDTEEFDVVELYNTNGADSAWHSLLS